MKIAICDDEKKLRKDLRSLIEIQMDLSGGDYTSKNLKTEGTSRLPKKRKIFRFCFWISRCPGWTVWRRQRRSALPDAGC